MTERREHDEFDKLLSSESGFGDGELQQLAKLARALERNRPPLAVPSPAFRHALRGRVVEEIRNDVVIPLSAGARIRATVAARNARMRRSLRSVVAVAAAAAMFLVSGAAFAMTASSRPDQAGYSVKRFRESAQLLITRGNAQKAYKQLNFARIRLEEVQALKDAGVEKSAPYVRALADMDSLTTDSTSRLIREFRATNNSGVLQPLVRFSLAQRSGLESVFDQLPPSARPAARSSLELVTTVQERVSDVLSGCPCSDNVFVPSASISAPAPCVCSTDRTDSTGVPKGNVPPQAGPTERGPTGTTPSGEDNDGQQEKPRILPKVEGTTLDDAAEDLIQDLLSPLPTPIVLPTLPTLP